MLSITSLKNIRACLASCDELIAGRFIYAENVINKLITDISSSSELYDLINKCMVDFNFDREFSKAKIKLPTKNGYFIMPENAEIILPMVFCMLVDIKEKKIIFNDFLKMFFSSEPLTPFENFIKQVIIPFKNAIIYYFSVDMQREEEQEDEVDIPSDITQEQQVNEALDKLVADLKSLIENLKNAILNDGRIGQMQSEDCLHLCSVLVYACNEKHCAYIIALCKAIKYALNGIKDQKHWQFRLNYYIEEFSCL